MTTTTSCCACGRPDALGLGLCAECGTAGGDGDGLVFVRRSADRSDLMQTAGRLGGLLGDRLGTADGRAVVRGDRPLIRLPAVVAGRVVDVLERHGVAARSIAAERAWTAMPAHFFALIAAVALVGGMAGAATAAPLIWISPAFAAGLVLVAHRSVSRPLLRPPAAEALPPPVQAAVLNAFAKLGAGRPRELLADLVGIARPALASLRADGDPGALSDVIERMLVAACATALETDRLLDAAATVRDAMEAGNAAGELREAAAQCDQAGRTGLQRLVEAVAAMAGVSGRAAALDGGTGRQLAELTGALRRETGFREDALRQVDRLLGR